MTQLTQVEGRLFSEGVRHNAHPRQTTEESSFDFLDRVRQPAFERQRSWWEAAFGRYPAGSDKKDVGRRFRSRDDAHHLGAAWELAQHELWRRLGWSLKPHPQTPDGRYRDFLVEHPKHETFYLECAVDLESSEHRKAERRWSVVEKALSSVSSPSHQLLIELQSIGDSPLATRELCQAAQTAVDRLVVGRSNLILNVDSSGWRFTVQAMELPSAGRPTVMRGGVLSPEERLYNPIRGRIIDKAKRSAHLDKPFVVALLLMYPLPILSKANVVEEALFGTSALELGSRRQALGEMNRRGGIWFEGTRVRRTGVSAILMQQDLWPGQQLPTLYLHPAADRSYTAPLPLGVCRYELTSGGIQAHRKDPSIVPQELFGLPNRWPGPEDWFEGINNDNPLPAPEFWTPHAVRSTDS